MAKPGIGTKEGHQNATEPKGRLTEAELSNEMMGKNRLQGDDQLNVRNERQSVPDAKLEPDASPVESARLTDKDARAEAELGKGNRHGGGAGGKERSE